MIEMIATGLQAIIGLAMLMMVLMLPVFMALGIRLVWRLLQHRDSGGKTWGER